MTSVLVFCTMLAIGWYVIITRPQRAQQIAHHSLINQLTVGDHVMTVGGVYGRITGIDGTVVTLDLGGVSTRVATDAIARIVDEAEAALPAAPMQQQYSQEPVPAQTNHGQTMHNHTPPQHPAPTFATAPQEPVAVPRPGIAPAQQTFRSAVGDMTPAPFTYAAAPASTPAPFATPAAPAVPVSSVVAETPAAHAPRELDANTTAQLERARSERAELAELYAEIHGPAVMAADAPHVRVPRAATPPAPRVSQQAVASADPRELFISNTRAATPWPDQTPAQPAPRIAAPSQPMPARAQAIDEQFPQPLRLPRFEAPSVQPFQRRGHLTSWLDDARRTANNSADVTAS